jgi:hypothetical protein
VNSDESKRSIPAVKFLLLKSSLVMSNPCVYHVSHVLGLDTPLPHHGGGRGIQQEMSSGASPLQLDGAIGTVLKPG